MLTRVATAATRNPALPVLLIGGATLLGSGLLAALIVRVVMPQSGSGALPMLPEEAYTGSSPRPTSPFALDNTLTGIFIGVAALGLLMLAVAVVLRRSRSLVVWLLVPGALIAMGGSIGGVAAKRSADITSYLASQPKALVSNDLSNDLGLNFDPSSAHLVPPNYTGLWLGITIAAVGVLVLLAGVIIAITKKRLTTTTQ